MKNLVVASALCIACCLTVGCGPGGNNVSGKVTMADGSAIPRGVVQLNGPEGSHAVKCNDDGTYLIENVAEGTYNVGVTGVTAEEPSTGDTEEDMYNADGTPKEAGPEPKSLVLEKYGNPAESGLTVTVPGGSYDLKLDSATP